MSLRSGMPRGSRSHPGATRLPFDVAGERTIFYTNDMAGVPELAAKLRVMADAAINDETPDNPIYRGAKSLIMREVAPTDADRFLLDRLDRLEVLISESLRRVPHMFVSDTPRSPKPGSGYRIVVRGSKQNRDELISSVLARDELSEMHREVAGDRDIYEFPSLTPQGARVFAKLATDAGLTIDASPFTRVPDDQ